MREAAEKACYDGGYDGPTASLNEFCTAALNMIDLVDELAKEAQDLGLDDPEKSLKQVIEWKNRGEAALTRLRLLDGAKSVFALSLTTVATILTVMAF